MRIIILTLLLLISNFTVAQDKANELKFNTKYFNAVDKWVAFPKKDSDSTFVYGFVYLDNQAGFTFDYKSKFKIEKNSIKNIQQDTTVGSMKYRLQPNTVLVSVLNKKQILDLKLPKYPDWLAIYKKDSTQVEYLKNEGYHYNHVGASNLALRPLLKAYKIEPHFKGLEFELSYAYNALGDFNRAITVLEKAIKNNPDDFYFYRELGFSYKNLNKIEEAEKIYRKGIEISDNDFEKSEMAVNMAQSYFILRNKEKFEEWAELTRKFADKNSKYAQFIDQFEQNWDK